MMKDLHEMARSDEHAPLLRSVLFEEGDSIASSLSQALARPYINLLELDDELNNVTALHVAASKDCIQVANLLVTHAKAMDMNMIDRKGEDFMYRLVGGNTGYLTALLTARDRESGYTPLHLALLLGNVRMSYFLMSCCCNGNDGLLLSMSSPSIQWEMCLDHEGLSPTRLISKRLVKGLNECRDNLKALLKRKIRLPVGRSRTHSFTHDLDPEEERNEVDSRLRPNVNDLKTSSACEVVTFGRANHFALGVPKFSQGSDETTNCSKRVPAFGIEHCMSSYSGTAVDVSAATHHSLVLTSNGHVYSFGHGKGGRLGLKNEADVQVPTRIMGAFENRIVISISAAENHSLACTRDGKVYSWGSNRFGQLGLGLSKSLSRSSFFSPRKLEDLKREFIIKVAAGNRHSLCLTLEGKVFSWGDSSAGQLGVNTPMNDGKVNQVTSLWESDPRMLVFDIAAGDQSSLVLTHADNASTHLHLANVLYEWGNGIKYPSKVNFPHRRSKSLNSTKIVNPVKISGGKYHNVAISEDGRVYSWGFHSESLGTKTSTGICSKKHNIRTPQLVSSLMSEFVVDVSATDDHTYCVTDTGDLFSYGVSESTIALGHEGVRFQPSPRKVENVQRVIRVAAAREHTLLLIGTCLPSFEQHNRLQCKQNLRTVVSLQEICFESLSSHIDLFNGPSLYANADALFCSDLSRFANKFMKANLDGILCFNKRRHLELLLNQIECSHVEITNKDSNPICDNVSSSHNLLERSKRLVKSLLLENCQPEYLNSKYIMISKELRGLRKKLTNIIELQKCGKALSCDQLRKVSRKESIEASIALLTPYQKRVVDKMSHFNIMPVQRKGRDSISRNVMDEISDCDIKTSHVNQNTEANKCTMASPRKGHQDIKKNSNRKTFTCKICNISCPDNDTLSLHLVGKKHRNRLNKIKKAECAEVVSKLARNVTTRATESSAKGWDIMVSPTPNRFPNQKVPRKLSFQEILNEESPGDNSGKASAKLSFHEISDGESLREKHERDSRKLTFQEILNEELQKGKCGSVLLTKKKCNTTSNVSINILSNSTSSMRTPNKNRKNASTSSSPWTAESKERGSFQDILREEEIRRVSEDTRGVNDQGSNHWFLEQRQRAGSFAEIQRADEEEVEMRRIVDEQLKIEAQIAEMNRKKEKQKKSKGRNKARKPDRRKDISKVCSRVNEKRDERKGKAGVL